MADEFGYGDKDNMICTLYRKIGAPTMAALLGVDQNSILDRLQRLGVAKRKQGGPNNRRVPHNAQLPCGRVICRHCRALTVRQAARVGCPASEIGREHCEKYE
jgi:hypothetical protein